MFRRTAHRTTVFACIVVAGVAVACGSDGGVTGNTNNAQLYCIEGNAGACGCGYSTAPIEDPEATCPPATKTPGWVWYCASTEKWPASGGSCNCGAFSCIDDSAVPAASTCSCGVATPGVTTAATCPLPSANDACCLGADGTCTCYYGTNTCSKAGDIPVSVASCDATRAATAMMAAMNGNPTALPKVVDACH